jgi:hypothetical protein
MSKLVVGTIHLLRLTAKGADPEGWSKVSKLLWPTCSKLPDDLVEKRQSDDGGHIRLTSDGEAIVRYI